MCNWISAISEPIGRRARSRPRCWSMRPQTPTTFRRSGTCSGSSSANGDGWSGPKRSLRLATGARWSPPDVDEPAYLRLKGAKALPGRSLAVLRELFHWRDQLARRTDKAAFRILNNEPMLAHGADTPGRSGGSSRPCGESAESRRSEEDARFWRRYSAVWQFRRRTCRRVERPPRRPSDPAYEARLERLKAAGNLLAAQYELAPGVLCPNGTLEAIARLNPATVDELARGAGAAPLAADARSAARFSTALRRPAA